MSGGWTRGWSVLKLFLWDKHRQDQSVLLEAIRIAVNLGVMTGRKHRGAFRGAGKFCFLIRCRLHRCVQLVKTHNLRICILLICAHFCVYHTLVNSFRSCFCDDIRLNHTKNKSVIAINLTKNYQAGLRFELRRKRLTRSQMFLL